MADKRSRRGGVPFVPNTLKLLGLILIIFGFIVVFRQGYIPARYSPFATVDLADPTGWFLDWRIAQLADDKITCRAIFTKPHIIASRVKDRGTRDGCGWYNAYRVSKAGGAAITPAMTMQCGEAAAVAMWIRYAVQPAAKRYFGSKVTQVRNVGGYSCRRIRGGIGEIFNIRSEHARANALDVTAFQLANGTSVSVLRDWYRKGPKREFLRAVHAGACDFFRVTLGPEANVDHRDHFHLDRGPLRSCR
ncbi:MAG: extensin family protein [Hyphomicrobiaceae bacterium]